MLPDDRARLPAGWQDDDLAQTVRDVAGAGSDAGAAPDARFRWNVVRLIRKRLQQDRAGADPRQPAIFLLQPEPPPQILDVISDRIPFFFNGMTQVTGRVWFVNAVVQTGRYCPFEGDDEDLVTLVTRRLGQGAIPAIMFDPRPEVPEAHLFWKGLDSLDDNVPLALDDAQVDLEAILAIIDRVYAEILITPEFQIRDCSPWFDGDRWRPVERAEQRIQAYVHSGLVGHLPATYEVRPEQTMQEGRADLDIAWQDPFNPGHVIHHTILELKVLRSYGQGGATVSSRETLLAIAKGFRQAVAYQRRKRSRYAALCCFDMRRAGPGGDECFDHVRVHAQRLSIGLRRWYLYAKSEYRRGTMVAELLEADS